LLSVECLTFISLTAQIIEEKFCKFSELLSRFSALEKLHIDAHFVKDDFESKPCFFCRFKNLSYFTITFSNPIKTQKSLQTSKIATTATSLLTSLERLSLNFLDEKKGLSATEFGYITQCLKFNLTTLKSLDVTAPAGNIGNKKFMEFMSTLPKCSNLEELTLIFRTTNTDSQTEFLVSALDLLGSISNLRSLKFILHDDAFCFQEQAVQSLARSLKNLKSLQDLDIVVQRKWCEIKPPQYLNYLLFSEAIKKLQNLNRIRLHFGNHLMTAQFLDCLVKKLLMIRTLKYAYIWSGNEQIYQGIEDLVYKYKSTCLFNFYSVWFVTNLW